MWDPGQGVHLFLFGFPVKPAFCKTRTGSSTHVAFVGRSVCDWHTRTVHGLEHSICSVNVTCNSDLLMFFVCVCVCMLRGVCACVYKCMEVKGHLQLSYVPQELAHLLLETRSLVFTWNSQRFSRAGYKFRPDPMNLHTPHTYIHTCK